ncbi:MAG: lysR [Polyangiaceae bacterium]|jgi:DNA-binding transcriptional LysR family regulator|nr:lysR [Polyangiaceae bacterium]
MSDSFTLEQLRTFVAVNEAGNFSAAARKLERVQSAVSTTMANLEQQLGLTLWDRSTRIATLTEHGRVILAAASRVVGEAETLRRTAADLVGGVEARVALCVDALFPVAALVELALEFARAFPQVDLHVDTETLSAVSERVLGGTATLGVVSPLGVRPGLERRALASVRMIAVVAAGHPLAKRKGALDTSAFNDFVQIVLSERQDSGVPDQAVLSPRTWRTTDLHTKRALIVGGAGWGNLPHHFIADDLARKRLVTLRPAAWAEDEHTLVLSLVHRRDLVLGPAHRWLVSRLEALCEQELGQPRRKASRRGRSSA